MFTVDLNGEELATRWVQVRATIRVGMRKAVSLGVTEGAEEARSQHRFKNKTGELEKSIVGRVTASRTSVGASGGTNVPRSESVRTALDPNDGAHFGEIKAGAKYASFVENGTRSHIIVPVRKFWLRWVEVGGGVRFAKRVRHPGTKPYGFMAQAYLKCERVMIREVERSVDAAQQVLDK